MRRRIILAATLIVIAAHALAQQHPNQQRGFAPNVRPQGEVDSINLFNGTLVLAIPLATFPMNESFGYGFTLYYSGNVWDYQGTVCSGQTKTQAIPNRRSNAGLGWLLTFNGRLVPPTDPTNEWGNYLYESPDGADHLFHTTLHGDASTIVTGVWYTRDGTYLRLRRGAWDPGYGKYDFEIDFPDGRIHKFKANGQEELRDRYGNTVTITYTYSGSGNTWTITDTIGRTHTVRFRVFGSIQVVDSVDLAGPEGTRSLWQFSYAETQIDRGYGDTDPCNSVTVLAQLLTGLTLPDGTTYSMPSSDYTTTGSTTGSLKAVTLPTKGRIEWTYGLLLFPDGSSTQPHRRHSIGVTQRKTINPHTGATATWTHQHVLSSQILCSPNPPGGQRYLTKTITTPEGHRRIDNFSTFVPGDLCANSEGWRSQEYGLPFTRSTASNGTFLSTQIIPSGAGSAARLSYASYEVTGCGSGINAGDLDCNRRLIKQRTEYPGAFGPWDDVTYSDFDGLGHYRQILFGGAIPNPGDPSVGSQRTEYTNYNPGYNQFAFKNALFFPATDPWILQTFDSTWQRERDWTTGTDVTARQEYCFEGTTGFLTRARILVGDSPGSTDLLTVNTRDAAGNTIREEFFGGDYQSVITGALCGLAPPAHTAYSYRIEHAWSYGVKSSSEYREVNGARFTFKTLDRDIDLNTGLTTVSREAAVYDANGNRTNAGLATAYDYDALRRIRWVRPPSGHGSPAEYVYTAATPSSLAKTTTFHRANSDTTLVLAKSETQYDAFGRVRNERRLLPPNGASERWSLRQTAYDGSGRVVTVSETVDDGTSLPVTAYEYDAFDRVTKMTPPDCADHAVTFTYGGVDTIHRIGKVATTAGGTCATGQSAVDVYEKYDRFGRLWQVIELNGISTVYTYDVGHRLKRVQTFGPTATQTRLFSYDRRGFLPSETLPEKGTGNGSVTYQYDARGHARKRIDGSYLFDVTFTYDRAERLTEVRETGARLLKQFAYGASNSGSNFANGKRITATRYNWIDHLGLAITVTEGYEYAGRDGRASKRTTTHTEGSVVRSFSQNFQWNDLGAPSQIHYPDCTFPTCTTVARTITLTNTGTDPAYKSGFLVKVPGYANSISYWANGMINQIAHANGVTWTQAIHPANKMARPISYETTGAYDANGNAANWVAGNYVYDGSGNISAIGGESFKYDIAARLVEGNISVPGSGTQQQSTEYDVHGNVTRLVTNGTDRTFSVSASTNRISGYAYDYAGNLTAADGATFYYDRLSKMYGLVGGSRDEVYVYTADDQRIRIWDRPSVLSRWRIRDLNAKVLREFVEAGGQTGWAKDFAYRADGALLSEITGSGVRHIHSDHLGSTRLVTTTNGYVPERHTFFPFGQEATATSSTDTPIKFKGQERDEKPLEPLILDYQLFGHYSPALARSQSADLSSKSPSSPQSWNAYAVEMDNPLNGRRRGARRNTSTDRIRVLCQPGCKCYDDPERGYTVECPGPSGPGPSDPFPGSIIPWPALTHEMPLRGGPALRDSHTAAKSAQCRKKAAKTLGKCIAIMFPLIALPADWLLVGCLTLPPPLNLECIILVLGGLEAVELAVIAGCLVQAYEVYKECDP